LQDYGNAIPNKSHFIFLNSLCVATVGAEPEVSRKDDITRQGAMTMLSKTRIALSIAIVLVTASAGMAATQHRIHHHRASIERQLPGASTYGYANFGNAYPPSVLEALKRQAAGDPRCWGGNCDPVSGEGTIAN
jgi:hypothetical protein